MRRRTLLAAGAAALAAPRLAGAQNARVLRFIPQTDLTVLDPVWTTVYATREHANMVFDTLYGTDSQYRASPQMVAGHAVEDGGLRWDLTLRDGLLWHDGERVLARDCVASIRRWGQRDPFGQALLDATDELSAPDDRTIRFRLKRPFPLLPAALGKLPSTIPAMMPERLARTDAFTQVTEMVGSGPFRFLADERISGARAAYARFERYVPRPDGVSDWTAGPKVVHVDRVEWTTIADPATAAAALQSGEQDWWNYAASDLVPLLRRAAGLKVEALDPSGLFCLMRLNHLQPPFNNPAIRRAMLHAFSQADFMQAIVGNDPAMYHTPHGVFCPNTPMASEAGLEPLVGPRDLEKVKRMLKEAGYASEKTTMLVATDYAQFKAIGEVAADVMGRIGMNVDFVATDWGTMLQRRNNRGQVDQGGWSCFATGWEGVDHMDPSNHYAIRGNGNDTGAWPGWCVSPKLEALRTAWFDAPDVPAQQAICREMQVQCMQDVPSIPLGQYIQPTAYRSTITGVSKGFPTFWNVQRA